ncbi:MAG: hemerythrin domain-containing protein [Magnetospiraceae bacterium]
MRRELFFKQGRLSTGIDHLDTQHWELYRKAQYLNLLMSREDTFLEAARVFACLVQETTNHFKDEEALFGNLPQGVAKLHLKEHKKLLCEMMRFARDLQLGDQHDHYQAYLRIDRMLERHFSTHDQAFKKFIPQAIAS